MGKKRKNKVPSEVIVNIVREFKGDHSRTFTGMGFMEDKDKKGIKHFKEKKK